MNRQANFTFVLISLVLLILSPEISAQFCNTPIGFGRNATGGSGGTVYTVTNRNDSGTGSLRAALESTNTYIIKFSVTGTITLNSDINIKSNKTVDGDGTYIRIRPYVFKINNQENVIIRNLHFDSDGNSHTGASGDAIGIQNGSRKIWIDHCSFEDYYDGLIDIIRESDNITVTWCYFRGHHKVMLIGHSDAHTVDAGKLNVTVHHNYYDGTTQRHPRIRFGRAHVFNNYLKNISEMGLCSGTDAKMVIENNRFENVVKPAVLKYDSNWEGYITESGNQRINTVPLHTRTPTFTPSSIYPYSLETADNTLRDFLIAYTGYNKTTNMALTISGSTMTVNYLARSFQWYRNGTAISGATSNSYTAPNCGTYAVRLYGDQGCYKELSHTITTGQPAVPTITVVGGNAFFCTGSSVTLRSSAAPANYSYQWLRNNTDISGATSRDYAATQAGNYRVRLTGACPTANSAQTVVSYNGDGDCNGVCNGTAIIDDCGTCSGGNTGITPNSGKDCNGICGGSATLDCAGVCGGSAVADCAGMCGGTTTVDCAGVCGGNAAFDCAGGCDGVTEDCNGVCGGSEVLDCDGVCGGTATVDCHGDCNGTALVDDCGICSGGNSGHVANSNKDCAGVCFGATVADCNNDCGGTALIDDCGVCSGGNTQHDADSDKDCTGVCFGTAVPDCNGDCNGTAITDSCGFCLEPNDPDFNMLCMGCDGVANSGFVTDTCGQCLHPADINFNYCETSALNVAGQKNPRVKIFPNPYFDKLYVCIESISYQNALIEIYSMDGRKITEKNMRQSCIELVNLPVVRGLYFVRITNEQGEIYNGKVFRD